MINLKETKVIHKAFGEGIVTEFDNQYITVEFATKTSKFTYPDVFEKFIKSQNIDIQSAIMNDLTEIKRAQEENLQNEIQSRQAKEEEQVATRQVTASNKKKTVNIEDGFDENYHVAYLAKHPILTYREVEEQFKIKIYGFGRGINKTSSSIVLISSIDKKKTGFVYHDKWTCDGDYIYSGEGKNGDQLMTAGNKSIVEAGSQGKVIHLFVKFSPKEYYYQGVFTLADYKYENDIDETGNIRKEYKFRLSKVSDIQ